jgi:hypothetical protein
VVRAKGVIMLLSNQCFSELLYLSCNMVPVAQVLVLIVRLAFSLTAGHSNRIMIRHDSEWSNNIHWTISRETELSKQQHLKVTSVNKVAFCVFRGNDIQHFVHIKKHPIPKRKPVVILVTSQPVLDLRKCFFNRVQIWRIWW